MNANAMAGGRSSDERDFRERAREALASGEHDRVSDDELADVLTLATRLYAAKSEANGPTFQPVREEVSATEVVVTVSGMLHATNLNLFDVAMWYRRPGFGQIPVGGLR